MIHTAMEIAYELMNNHADRLTLEQRILCLAVNIAPCERVTPEVAGQVIAIGCAVLAART